MGELKRIFHTYDKWECYPAGFFEDTPFEGKSTSDMEEHFAEFFREEGAFESGLIRVFSEWPNSVEHNLTNDKRNRIAWLGQAACCISTGIPSSFRSGFMTLSPGEREEADKLALRYLNKWLTALGHVETDGIRNHKSSDIY